VGWDPITRPCPWWSPATEAEHSAWLAAAVPAPVPYEELDSRRQWAAGQPVLLRTGGHEHRAYVRLEGFCFQPRWLSGSIKDRRVSPAELTLRDPREVWADAYELALAEALLSAPHDDRLAWLRDIDEATERELADLLWRAQEELARRPTPTPGPVPMPSPAPAPRRGWTRAEIEALRLPEGVVEPVNPTPEHQALTGSTSVVHC
jgi:hypothetical protein